MTLGCEDHGFGLYGHLVLFLTVQHRIFGDGLWDVFGNWGLLAIWRWSGRVGQLLIVAAVVVVISWKAWRSEANQLDRLKCRLGKGRTGDHVFPDRLQGLGVSLR